jgi:hypothetical protein
MGLRQTARSGRRVLLGAAILLALSTSSPARALDPPYLGEFPDPERVAKDFAQGDDRMDTLAHQVAALNRLYQLAAEMAGERRYRPGPQEFPNADEFALRTRIGKVSGPRWPQACWSWLRCVDSADATPRFRLRNRGFPPPIGNASGSGFWNTRERSLV